MPALRKHVSVASFLAITCIAISAVNPPLGRAQEKSLAEKDLVTLLQLQIDPAAIAAKVQKSGLAFTADDAALARLKEAGASESVLQAVRESSSKAKTSTPGVQPITYPDLLKLVSLGLDEAVILQRLEKSPTLFTLGADQVAELKKAGATDKLLAALQGPRPASPQAAELITDFAIVLDCSGSMKELTKERESKMVAAQRVVSDLVRKIPEGLNVTFVIYGQEVFASPQDPRNCQAVKVARPISPLDTSGKSELTTLISKLKPTGATPIALALQTAGRELAKNDAFCGVILITDGLESCGGNPAAEAAALAANPKLTFGVNVVGFGAKPEEDAQLKSIADAGKGKYYDADSSADLAKAMAAVAQELEVKAQPAEGKVARRAVKVLQPAIAGFPPLGEIQLVSYGLGSLSIEAKGGYGEDIRVPSGTTKYDVKWAPKGDGLPVAMLKDHVFAERKVVVVKPEEHLGLLKVSGTGNVKNIRVYQRGLGSIIVFQEAKKWGEIMVVPAGTYFIEADGNQLEEGFKIEAGKLHELE